MEKLRTASSLDREGLKPWHLKLSFVLNDLNGKPQDSGIADVVWTSPHEEKVEVESQLLHGQVAESVASGDTKAAREAFLVKALIAETTDPVQTLPSADFNVTEQKTNFGKVTLTCLTVVRKTPAPTGGADVPEYCVEPQSPDVLRVTRSSVGATVRNRLGKFQDTNVALDNTIAYGGVAAIIGKTESLASIEIHTAATEESSATPKAKAEAAQPSSVPAAVVAGSKTGGANPQYPSMARMQHISGSVVMEGIIDKTGRISQLVTIASPHPLLTESSVAAVKTWTYKPYLLNGEPVEVDTTITVHFNMSVR